MDDALPEYCLLLLANKHNPEKISSELGAFLGDASAASFTEWLFQAYRQLKETHSEVQTSVAINNGDDQGTERRRPVVLASRMFRSAVKEATRFDNRREMVVDQDSSMNNNELPPPNDKASRRERDYLDRELDAIISQRHQKRQQQQPKEFKHAQAFNNRQPRRASQTVVVVQKEKAVRCPQFPVCKAESCPFFHPTEQCRFFPNCSFPDACLYVHPVIPCRFQEHCSNPSCNFQHAASFSIVTTTTTTNAPVGQSNQPVPIQQQANPPQAAVAVPLLIQSPMILQASQQNRILCRYFPKCTAPACPFLHPSSVVCRFGEACIRVDCLYAHPTGRLFTGPKSKVMAPCVFGKSCTRLTCPYQHETPTSASPATLLIIQQQQPHQQPSFANMQTEKQ